MTTTNHVVLILGAGPRVGLAVATTFASKGYQVVLASRKGTGEKTVEGYLCLRADFNEPDSIPGLFHTVKAEMHAYPSVVIYNAAALTPPSDKDSALSIPVKALAADMNVNTLSPFVAAQEAIKGWETLPFDSKKTFIYTGNMANRAIIPVPMMLSLSVGKAASASWIGFADTMYSSKGYRFFYADERNDNGKMKGLELDGPAHGAFYADLATHAGSVPWDATFVEGKGYVKFD